MPTYKVAFARYIAGLMMHIAMINEIKEGFGKMKFALNHFWRFDLVSLAFLVGFLQATMVVLVTLLNYYVIIAKSLDVIDVAKDFLAMMIIADFDNIFFLEYPNSNVLKSIVLQHIEYKVSFFKIQTTTSKECVKSETNPQLNKLIPLQSSVFMNQMRKSLGKNYRPLPEPS